MERKSIRILVVDDEVGVRNNLVTFLEDEGFKVSSADSGSHAMAVLEAEEFDLSIVDLRMPGMNGIEFIVKAHEIHPAMRFLIHTGSLSFMIPPSLEKVGIRETDLFRKPLDNMTVLTEAILERMRDRS